MPNVIFVEPEYADGPHLSPNDDHAPTGVQPGQAFLSELYQTLTSNPARWSKTMLVITYDEHGGFFDHVSAKSNANRVRRFWSIPLSEPPKKKSARYPKLTLAFGNWSVIPANPPRSGIVTDRELSRTVGPLAYPPFRTTGPRVYPPNFVSWYLKRAPILL